MNTASEIWSKVLDLLSAELTSTAISTWFDDCTAVELLERHLAVLRENSRGIGSLEAVQGDATDLGRFADNTFDVTLSLGPMYHLYEKDEIDKAIDEAIRVTKPGGAVLFAFISVYGIMYANYLQGNWAAGEEENFLHPGVGDALRFRNGNLYLGLEVRLFQPK